MGSVLPIISKKKTDEIISLDVEEFLTLWDRDVRRASQAAAKRYGAGESFSDDIAQEVRLRLFTNAARLAGKPDEYIRTAIRNALNSFIGKELKVVCLFRSEACTLEEEEFAKEPGGGDVDTDQGIKDWLLALPLKSREIYHLLYAHGYSQREAALLLGVSQPRVSQLHSSLLEMGRIEFGASAA